MRRLSGSAVAAAGLAASLGLVAGCMGDGVKPLPVPPDTVHAADLRVDLEYAPDSAKQRLDLHVPEGDRPSPLVVLVHSGGWAQGDKGDFGDDTVTAFTKAGYAVAAINYRLTEEATWPAGVQDAKAAVRWLRAHAADYHLDAERFAILGVSAGGYLAAAVGLTGDRQTPFDDPKLGSLEVSAAVKAVILWSAPTDFRTLDGQLAKEGCPAFSRGHGLPGSPESKWLGETVSEGGPVATQAGLLRFIDQVNQLPSFQILHGTADCTIPSGQSRSLHNALRRANAHSSVSLIKGMKHEDRKYTKRLVKMATAFLGQQFRA